MDSARLTAPTIFWSGRRQAGRASGLVSRRRPGLEQRAGLGINRRGVLPVAFESLEHVTPVEAGELLP